MSAKTKNILARMGTVKREKAMLRFRLRNYWFCVSVVRNGLTTRP